jgi:hypothetical protein
VHLVRDTSGTTHFDILDADRALGQRVVGLIERVVRETAPAPVAEGPPPLG